MDGFSSRKTASGLFFSSKRSGLVLRESSNDSHRRRNTPICSRVGCSSRMSSIQDNQTGPDKAKSVRRPFYPPRNGKEAAGSSSRIPVAPGPRKSSDPRKKLPFHQVADSEPSSLPEETEGLGRVICKHNAHDMGSSRAQTDVSGESTSFEANSSVSVPCSRHGKEAIRSAELGICDSSTRLSSSLAIKHGNHGSRSGASSSKYNLKSLKCNLLNDVEPSSTLTSASCSSSLPSSSELILGRNRAAGRKRIGEVGSSLPTRGTKISGLQPEKRKENDSHHGICISDSTRRRNLSTTRNGDVTSAMTWRSAAARARLNEQENRSRIQQTESSSLLPLFPQPGIAFDTNPSISEYQFPFRSTNLTSRLGNNSANIPSNASLAPLRVGFGRSSTRREDARNYNSNGIAEMLLALDRIDQDDDMTYEQLIVLETNIFLRGLAFHDQHRDMRLDIDSMSYEQLLELEERMGTVSTALSEEALVNCLRKSIYESAMDEGTEAEDDGDDIKCSICQEEYEDGNEVGRLVCAHRYHLDCIHRWLQLKNWCPICKASAAPSPSS